MLPRPEAFQDLVRRESEAATAADAYSSYREYPGYHTMLQADPGLVNGLREGLAELTDGIKWAMDCPHRWVQKARKEILAGQESAWVKRLESTRICLKQMAPKVDSAPKSEVAYPRGKPLHEIKADAEALVDHLEAGGRLGFWIFRPSIVKSRLYLLKEVKVNGKPCADFGQLRALADWCLVMESLRSLRIHWEGLFRNVGTGFVRQLNEYTSVVEVLERILRLRGTRDMVASLVDQIPGLAKPAWNAEEDLGTLTNAVDAAVRESDLLCAKEMIQAETATLAGAVRNENLHSCVRRLMEAVEAREGRAYEAAFTELTEIKALEPDIKECGELLSRLRNEAPELANKLEGSFLDEEWENSLVTLEKAWNWAGCDAWLRALTQPGEEERLKGKLIEAQREAARIMEKLIEAKAWGHCFENLEDEHLSSLAGWQAAINKVGRGTGKFAEKNRKTARKNMNNCRSAIPAWIMPIFRVVETIKAQPSLFDVVILDEASQSGPEAMFLYYLGKKVVIVGDDKQISPESFISLDQVGKLQECWIKDLEHRDAFGPDYSFFDSARIFYPKSIRLQEHFRCMPEIIQFSNNLCYRDQPLIPLRQYGGGRLDPVKIVHVSDGNEKGTGSKIVNHPEAEALVDRISQCIRDERYKDKSMGVISLLAGAQAQLIENRLREEIGPQEMALRHLVCGDAYAFQGDERDVIFLSLVKAPLDGKAIMALTSARDERRFNVAASRARDQIWLFHTVDQNDLLNPHCVRRKLIDYFRNPHIDDTTGSIDWELLRKNCHNNIIRQGKPPDLFESWFEADVGLAIHDRGFRVTPQFIVDRYRIDLIVQGLKGRLAVECDGDKFHPLEKMEEDMARQRDLERAGFSFWRVRGSTFYRDRRAALESLWRTLDEHEIRPSMHTDAHLDTTDNAKKIESASEPVNPKGKESGKVRKGGATERKTASAPESPGVDDEVGSRGQIGIAGGERPPEATPDIPYEIDLSVPTLLLADCIGGTITGDDRWEKVEEHVRYGSRSENTPPEWPADFRERFRWALDRLCEQKLMKQAVYRKGTDGADVEWEITDAGRKRLREEGLA